MWDDLATFDARPWRGAVDLLTAGYPCQPFSAAGRTLAERDPSHLWPHVARTASEAAPRWPFLENVSGHVDRGNQVSNAEAAKDWSVMRRVMTALGWTPGPMPAFPYSRRVLATIRPGSGCSPGEWILNPAFTEWLMGWPIGLSDTTQPVTAFAPWLQRSRGALSDIALIDV